MNPDKNAGMVAARFALFSRRNGTVVSGSVFVGYFLFCLLVQFATGAWSAPFLAYPDEPAHFVGAVMVRDWVLSGQWFSPMRFAQDYYSHYPFFAVGYWPPLFHGVSALVFLIAGVGRVQALLVPAACAAGTAWVVFRLLRPRTGVAAAACAGALYLSVPVVQRWVCAVMVDHMTAFLCLAAGVCVLRYLRRPGFASGILFAVVCGGAILAKYNAAYLAVLPLAAVVLLRRRDLLRKPSFLIQPVIVALMVGPWLVLANGWALTGLPAERTAVTAGRAAAFVVQTFRVFPPVLTALLIPGLLALLVLRRAWGQDVGILVLLGLGHLAFLILSPVDAEQRYLLAPAAVVLVLSFAGWAAVLRRYGSANGRYGAVVPVSAAVLTLAFAAAGFGRYRRPSHYPIRQIAESVLSHEAWNGQRILVASRFEGAFIAEFAAYDRRRPGVYLLRESKVLSHMNWFGGDYSPRFPTPEEMTDYFRGHPVRLILLQELPDAERRPHERVVAEMIRRNPRQWRSAESFAPTGGSKFSCTIYEYVPEQSP